MDLVLMIIAICFRNSKEEKNYTALIALSIVGFVITLLLALGGTWYYALDSIWYIIDLILCLTADNPKTTNNQTDDTEDDD